jgi:hypothetical protein
MFAELNIFFDDSIEPLQPQQLHTQNKQFTDPREPLLIFLMLAESNNVILTERCTRTLSYIFLSFMTLKITPDYRRLLFAESKTVTHTTTFVGRPQRSRRHQKLHL